MVSLFRFYVILMIALLGTSIFSHPAHAELSIAVVDVEKLLTQSEAAKSIQKQVQEKRDALQSEFSKHEDELRNSEKALVESREKISQEEFKTKRQEFEKNLLEKQKLVQGKKRALEEAVIKATGKMRSEIATIVAGIAEAKKFQIVMTRQNIVIAEKALDITEEVMTKLNEKLKTVKLEVGQ